MLKSTFNGLQLSLSSFVYLLLPSKSAKSHEILRKLELIQGHPFQGHRSCCQSKAHMQLSIS